MLPHADSASPANARTDGAWLADLWSDDVEDLLVGLPAGRRELFELRVARWWPDLRAGLASAYAPGDVAPLERRIMLAAAAAFVERPPELSRLDQERTLEPDWFQRPRMLGYAAYADRFAGDLAGVRAQIPYLRELGVTYLHLMPVLRPRDGDNDGGYAVADYRQVRPDLGSMADLRELATALRAEGISLVLDLVLNHVAREHEWARAARAGDPRYRDYFYVYADRAVPDAFERSLPEVFPDFAPGSFTWDAELDGWVWTTFNTWQWDVRWSNPDVFVEYAEIVLLLANAGVEVLRLDAIAFLWKRLGTSCQNQPEVHALTQALRAIVRIACPAVVFKAEAIVAPSELAPYLGTGERYAKVSDLAYHNSLMVLTWSMLAEGDVRLAAHALQRIPVAPASTAWITYVRCHDDIGWAIDDDDAAAVGRSGYAHRSFLSDYYTGAYPTSAARGLVFQHNRATGDRRVSGTAAALAGLDAARGAGASGVDTAVARLLLAHAIALGWGGIPVLWMGDELGLPNDPAWASEPGHTGDNRWAHRPRMPWDGDAARRHDAASVPGRVFAGLRHLVEVRAGLPYLDARFGAQVLTPSDPAVLPVLRQHPLGPFLALYNVTGTWRPWPGHRLAELGLGSCVDAISSEPMTVGDDGMVWLPPFAARWLIPAG
ncbi:alpha-amylase family protein [Pengzhenrongella sicca]|uniref:Alpha-amylase family protein n=1 Tax=Pengzhenrongella sicca TaxID=2819238 RepID=A0A8A4ZJ21_9MICO|nr:alpha-amylase family protein [Pengzhenrongella sicca]QTE29598.1 alpha-amylase family protein [Pengzhenrongella sicca]